MWPFKKKEPKEITPPPVPEVWDWNSAVGSRIQHIINQDPGVLDVVAQMEVPRLSVRFDGVGTATLSLNRSESEEYDGKISIEPLYWVAHDPDADRRGFGLMDYGPDGSARLTVPTSIMEQTTRGLIFMIDNQDSMMLQPSHRMPNASEITNLKNRQGTQKIRVGIGTRPEKYLYIPQ